MPGGQNADLNVVVPIDPTKVSGPIGAARFPRNRLLRLQVLLVHRAAVHLPSFDAAHCEYTGHRAQGFLRCCCAVHLQLSPGSRSFFSKWLPGRASLGHFQLVHIGTKVSGVLGDCQGHQRYIRVGGDFELRTLS